MKIKKGDLVACYLTNSEVYEELFDWGIVLEVNASLGDVLVLDKMGNAKWWRAKRWRLLEPSSLDSRENACKK